MTVFIWIVALVLTIPTYGLSLLAATIYSFFTIYLRARRDHIVRDAIVRANAVEGQGVFSKIYYEAARKFAYEHGLKKSEYENNEDSCLFHMMIAGVRKSIFISRDPDGYAMFIVDKPMF